MTCGELARRGAKVIMACRNLDKGQSAKEELLKLYSKSNPKCLEINVGAPSVTTSLKAIEPEQLQIEELDLASLQSIRNFAERIKESSEKLDFLVNNAGVTVQNYQTTVDGFELQIGVNHLGHFLLTMLLLPLLKKAAPSRITILSSVAHYWGTLYKPDLQIPKSEYAMMSAYYQSKLAVTMFAYELNKRLEGSGVTAVSVHPGLVKTELFRDVSKLRERIMAAILWVLDITPWLGAQTTMYALLTKNLVPGAYYSNCSVKRPNPLVLNAEEREWLWKKSCELLGLPESGESDK
ncbi:unnamed protein product [Calicophoron daubneyi]|uniref:Retinol dehydrogenase 12 n=1 Tax=Calicophoron daubneyi TaxID=300641 RepID=A0AAV2TR06_CALDB